MWKIKSPNYAGSILSCKSFFLSKSAVTNAEIIYVIHGSYILWQLKNGRARKEQTLFKAFD